MKMADEIDVKSGDGVEPGWPGIAGHSEPARAGHGTMLTAWPEYMVDALQRSILFLDLLRQRGNEEIEITSRPMATVLRFDHEVLMAAGRCRGR